MGGVDSTPYLDKVGVFISHLNEGSLAKRAGFYVNDHLLSVNGADLNSVTHSRAVELIKEAGDKLDILVEREVLDDGESKVNFL